MSASVFLRAFAVDRRSFMTGVGKSIIPHNYIKCSQQQQGASPRLMGDDTSDATMLQCQRLGALRKTDGC
jgi:hypothetical protein